MVMRQKEGRTVWCCIFQRLRGDLTAGAGFVVDHHRHTQLVFELVGQSAGNAVCAAPSGKAHQQFDRRLRLSCRTRQKQTGRKHQDAKKSEFWVCLHHVPIKMEAV